MADKAPYEFNPQAAVLAWLWPGLGHIAIGQRRRGRLVMAGVLFLFIGGLLIGGLDAVDSREDRLWFLAQAMNGPIAFGANLLNQNVIKTIQDQDLRLMTRGLARVNELGTLFIALAGLMNLVAVLDALHHRIAVEGDGPDARGRTDRRKDAA
jgi:hypothetical protein